MNGSKNELFNFLSNCRQAIGDKLYDKSSTIWKNYPEGRMTFTRATKILAGKEDQPENLNPSGEAYPAEDYECISASILSDKLKNTIVKKEKQPIKYAPLLLAIWAAAWSPLTTYGILKADMNSNTIF